MKLITSTADLNAEFRRLLKRYKWFYSAVAWAGCGSTSFAALLASKAKISQMIVGLHFYQTDPDFIETFIDHQRVRFIMQPDGTFHPKLYLFEDDARHWEMLVGSANFTAGGFGSNTEFMALLSSRDPGSTPVRTTAIASLDQAWSAAGQFTPDKLHAYRRMWRNQRPKLASLSGKYGEKRRITLPLHSVPVAIMTWPEFMVRVRAEQNGRHNMAERLKVLQMAREIFSTQAEFRLMTEHQRRFIGGLPSDLETEDIDSGWFGSMQGAGLFWSAIKGNDKNISAALDEIPLAGELTSEHYSRFIRRFQSSLPGNFLAPASRLLAIKRPDTFVCLDSKNRQRLCKDFAIAQTGMTYDRYWEEVICRIRDSEWWLNPSPKTDAERQVSDARAAFLDALYYNEA